MNWVAEALGSSAILAPGQSVREHARTVIQCLSLPIPEKHMYIHLGWRKISDRWCYLHAGGAIGPCGIEPGVEVSVPSALERHIFAAPPVAEARQAAVAASLQLLRVAPLRVTAPVYCGIWRAGLGETDFALHLAGPTGEGKSELAALAQQHYGAGMDARHLPASWSSTGNSLEGLAFAAKDALIVIDDFCPTGSAADIQRYHREADRILRAQGNTAGRMRMKADANLRPSKPPRGLILSTGEDIPRGHSLRARTLVDEVSPGDINWSILTKCQRDAAAGIYAQALASFIQWVAPQYEELKAQVKTHTQEWRLQIASEHKRTDDITASLAAGFHVFLSFATEVEAITAAEADELWAEVWHALMQISAVQTQHQADNDPARRFIELLSASISSGRAHLASPTGNEPALPEMWGWEVSYRGNGENTDLSARAKGERTGWVDGHDIYLEPDTSFAVVQKLTRDQGDTLPISAQTLRKRLKEKGYLASVDKAHETITIRRNLEGKQRNVLHLKESIFIEGLSSHKKPDKPDMNSCESRKAPARGRKAEEKPDTRNPTPDKPDTGPTRENNDKPGSYCENVGNVGFSSSVNSQPRKNNSQELFTEKNGVGNVGFPKNENPTSGNENPTSNDSAPLQYEYEEEI